MTAAPRARQHGPSRTGQRFAVDHQWPGDHESHAGDKQHRLANGRADQQEEAEQDQRIRGDLFPRTVRPSSSRIPEQVGATGTLRRRFERRASNGARRSHDTHCRGSARPSNGRPLGPPGRHEAPRDFSVRHRKIAREGAANVSRETAPRGSPRRDGSTDRLNRCASTHTPGTPDCRRASHAGRMDRMVDCCGQRACRRIAIRFRVVAPRG
jgi:hypothetical protein